MKKDEIPWLNNQHPNFKRWKAARQISADRGRFVFSLVSNIIDFNGLTVLDLGSGEGGTSSAFAENNLLLSFDISKLRLKRQDNFTNVKNKVCGSATNLPFKKKSFDLVILQDVVEHLSSTDQFANDIASLLKDNGIIYLSTPNRNSVLNFLADPHWGFPFISLFSREQIRKYFIRFFRKSEISRNDLAELLSLKRINFLFSKYFEIKLFTIYVVKELLSGNKGVIWSRFHLKLVSLVKKLKVDRLVIKISNDKHGIINNYFTPTFYLILSRKKGN